MVQYISVNILSRDLQQVIHETAKGIHTKTYTQNIREAVAIKEAQALRQDIFSYDEKGNATQDYDNLFQGLKFMIIGLFKKVVIADRISAMVDTVYNDPTQFTGIPVLIATILFSIQIYCDFSGYSDIALGTARLFGIELLKNFSFPYFSREIGF